MNGRHLPCLALVLLLVSGCASTEGSERSRTADVISRAEIEGLDVGSAFEVVERLRPRWLRTRGVTSLRDPTSGDAWVYVDGIRFGRIDSLHQLSRDSLIEVRRISARDAQTQFGTGHQGGVILVVTRH